MNQNLSIIIQSKAEPADLQIIEDGLTAFNLRYAPAYNNQPLVVLLRSDDNTLMGGLIGITYWGWLHVDTLWVAESFRDQGWGRRLLLAAEEEAVRRGCHHAFLDTMSFQALPFYERLGYTVYGKLQDFPMGHSRYFLHKALQTSIANIDRD